MRSWPVSPVFTDTEDQGLRGVPLSATLRRFGACFRICEGTAETRLWKPPPKQLLRLWNFSRPVQKLHAFLSHSWRTKGWVKYLSLLLQTGLGWAFLGYLLTLTAAIAASLLLDDLWTARSYPVRLQGWKRDLALPLGVTGIAPSFVALALLVTKPYLPRWWPRGGGEELIFLDCLCINQVDEELKRKGLAQLPLFLARSERLWILWGSDYFRRLWCVYEIAMYLREDPERPIRILMPDVDVAAFQIIMAFLGACCSGPFIRASPWTASWSFRLVVSLLTFIYWAPIVHYQRSLCRSRGQIRKDVLSFDCQAAECSEPADRSFILDSIKEHYGSCDCFNNYVRTVLQKQVDEVTGAGWPSYPTALFACLPFAGGHVDVCIACVRGRAPVLGIAQAAVLCVVFVSCVGPVMVRCLFLLTDRFSERAQGKWDVAKSCALTVPFYLLCHSFCGTWYFSLMDRLREGPVAVAAGFALVSVVVTWMVFFQNCGRGSCAKRGEAPPMATPCDRSNSSEEAWSNGVESPNNDASPREDVRAEADERNAGISFWEEGANLEGDQSGTSVTGAIVPASQTADHVECCKDCFKDACVSQAG